jgi:hypothetical protein
MALTSTCRQKRSMARGVWRFCSSQSSMLMRSRSLRRVRSRRMASSARAMANLSAALRHFIPRNEPVKCKAARAAVRAQHRDPPAGLDEVELAIEADAVADAQPLVEIQQVDAAAQQHVLAVVDGLGDLFAARRNRVGRGAAAQIRARLVQIHLPTVAAQGRRRRQPRQSRHPQSMKKYGKFAAFDRRRDRHPGLAGDHRR